ncbi:hypothetical protein RvY_16733 [Ramazzottius varieornatus]|uniref:Chromo domain-containing protein n=1 Tax=Ramazzottius varieornatus TaxID=947166 RepID=A0A1D1VZK0_RAMVA|nr:hypothetical protein RvY_16733 [Ramazzottius varieornatus]
MAEQEAMEVASGAMEAIKRKLEHDLQMSDDESEKEDRKNEPESSVVLPIFGKDDTEREPAQVADVQPVEVVEAKPARFIRRMAKMDAAVKDTVTHGLNVAVAAEKSRVTEEELVEELRNRDLIERLNPKQLVSRHEKKGGRKGRELKGNESDDSWTASGRPVKKPRPKAGATAPISQARSVRASASNQLRRLSQAKTREVSLPKTAPIRLNSPEIPVQVSRSARVTGQKRVLELEKIVEIRQVRQYLVKWKGENEMTWGYEDIFKGTKRAKFSFKL